MKAAAHSAPSVARRAPVATAHAGRPLIALAFEGLSEEQKELPFVLAYDMVGGALYERLCEQPEYYLGRAETLLLERHAAEISRWIGSQAAIVEYGAGTARSTPLLLRALHDPFAYLAIDVCAEQLERTCAQLQRRFRSLPIEGACQDFRELLSVPALLSRARRQVAYLGGSTIGAFEVLEAVELLSSIRETMGPDGGLLIGIDLVKPPAILERAYNDAAGVAAALNLNVLGRLNRELDGTFDLDAFRHCAAWDPAHQRIELSLVSLRTQAPCLAGIGVPLAANETIRTGYAHKYTPESFAALAHVAGWAVRHAWTEPQNQYSLLYLEGIE
jgi:dimethylhistidine N-methyltransferase